MDFKMIARSFGSSTNTSFLTSVATHLVWGDAYLHVLQKCNTSVIRQELTNAPVDSTEIDSLGNIHPHPYPPQLGRPSRVRQMPTLRRVQKYSVLEQGRDITWLGSKSRIDWFKITTLLI